MSPDDALVADVRVSEAVDRVVVTPRRPEDTHGIVRSLRASLPDVSFKRSPEGLWIPAHRADILLAARDEGIDLRWSAEARVVALNRLRVHQAHGRVFERVQEIRSSGSDLARTCLSDCSGLDVLDAHQLVNVAAMTVAESPGLCVFDEQGAGKTVTLIFAFDVLVSRDLVDFAVIVAPKSMIGEWPGDFARFRGEMYNVQIVSGSRREKRTAISSGADVLITNFETVVSMEDEFRATLQRRDGRGILVVDESFYAKNLDAARTRALRRIREYAGRAYVLCGTPAPNSPQDLVQQFSIVDFGVTFADVDVPKERSEAAPVVQHAIESRGLFIRHLKNEVLPDLPAKRFHRVLLDLAPRQQEAYRAALQDLILDLKSVDDRAFHRQLTSFLARRSALLQICSNPGSVVPGYTEVPAKLQALDEIIPEIIERRREKVIVWSFYTRSLETIVDRYGQFNPVRYDGSVTDVATRRDAVRRFQEDDETMLFVANPAAAGAGLTLHRARYAVYESLSNQAAHYLQSLDRIHRRGQVREVEYIMLLCNQTIEVAEYDRLVTKERAAQDLLGDRVDEPLTRESMLADAIAAENLLARQ